MPVFGKDAHKRLNETYDYIETVNRPGAQRVKDWVTNGSGHFSATSISEALSLGFGATIGTKDALRDAVRATMLCRIATDSSLSSLQITSNWKKNYLKNSESELRSEILKYVNLLTPPLSMPPGLLPTPSPTAYGLGHGVTSAQLASVHLKAPTPSAPKPVVNRLPVATSGRNFKKAIQHFDEISRTNVVLSGHGTLQVARNTVSSVLVGKHQEVRFYVADYYPLKNDVGQLVDSYQFPAPTETYGPGDMVPNYTLHFRDTLTLMNHSKGDTNFLTVPKNTTKLLSEFLAMPQYAATTFHWAACRVWMTVETGNVACPVHNLWEPYTGAAPHPCVLR